MNSCSDRVVEKPERAEGQGRCRGRSGEVRVVNGDTPRVWWMLQLDRRLLGHEGEHQYTPLAPVSVSASVYTPLNFSLTLNPLSCVQPHLSFYFYTHPPPPSIVHTSTHSPTLQITLVSDLYFCPHLLCKIFITVFLSNPLTSQEVRESAHKSDPGPLGLMGKRQDALPPPPFFYRLSPALVHPDPPLSPSCCLGFCTFTVRLLC